MKKLLISLVAVVLLTTSCTEVVFEEPQPAKAKALKEIPQEVHGAYSVFISNKNEIVKIGKDYVQSGTSKSALSDSLVIKEFDGKYVFSSRNMPAVEGGKPYWSVYVLEPKGCGFVKVTGFYVSNDENIEEAKAKFNGTVSGEGNDKKFRVRVTEEQFRALLADTNYAISVIMEKLE